MLHSQPGFNQFYSNLTATSIERFQDDIIYFPILEVWQKNQKLVRASQFFIMTIYNAEVG